MHNIGKMKSGVLLKLYQKIMLRGLAGGGGAISGTGQQGFLFIMTTMFLDMIVVE
jgi:hypothetical protein